MLTVINTTTMELVVTVLGMDISVAEAWAETIPYQNDFAIIAHTAQDLHPYTTNELRRLHYQLTDLPIAVDLDHHSVVDRVVRLLNARTTTSEMPPDEKRVATLRKSSEDNSMALTKKVAPAKAAVKPPVAKAAPAAKAVTKPAPVKGAKPPVAVGKAKAEKAPKPAKAPKAVKAEKVARPGQNGVLVPKAGSVTATIFGIADELSKKAGEPAKRVDVVARALAAGVKAGSATAGYQIWRKFHGLTK